ncbi:hypothetical protein CYMTET_15275 [Cymbomonas tetramitiformis]|uniref:YqaJ viral recombinase domain-containing protein n=1 Tax=Cymbomonas tetramitiformis TaxID=36881 RepID=A0AAE0GEL6_9CHLO|nr:hypothetical protein CYMTET_15275 [Cymbomonas tetramitiformis]
MILRNFTCPTNFNTKLQSRRQCSSSQQSLSQNSRDAICIVALQRAGGYDSRDPRTRADQAEEAETKDILPKVQQLLDIEATGAWPAQLSPEWRRARAQMLTASDVKTAIGENKHMTPKMLIDQKCGILPYPKENAAMRHGNYYEGEARHAYEAQSGETCFEFGLKSHEEISWLGGSPDGITASGRLVEIKCPYSKKSSPRGLLHRHYAQVNRASLSDS